MAKQKSTLRIIVPLVILLVGVGVAVLVAQTGGKSRPTQPTPDVVTDQTPAPAEPVGRQESAEPPGQQPEPAGEPPAPIEGLHARVAPGPVDLGDIGSVQEDSGYELRAVISPLGAGLESLELTAHFEELERLRHVVLQKTQPLRLGQVEATAVPFALTALIVNGTRVDLTSGPAGEPVWTRRAGGGPGELEATILDAEGRQVVRVHRTLRVQPHSHVVEIVQRAENLSDAPLNLRWIHTGPVSFKSAGGGYGGDKRRLRFGYWLNPKAQANDPAVLSYEFTEPLPKVIGVYRAPNGLYTAPVSEEIWPNPLSNKRGLRLVWMGITGRYFGVAMHPLVDPAGADKTLNAERVLRIAGVDPATPLNAERTEILNSAVLLGLLESRSMTVPPGGSASFDLGAYAGPLSRSAINEEPMARSLGLDGLVLYNFGGMCAWCTFQPLARLLLAVLRSVDSFTGDWGISIIILVIIVRTILHPVNRWSQIRVQRFSAQMQSIAPKMQKIKEKFKDDPKRQQQETTKLWKEEGINPAGMLGCLPMFLQSPVWIALYATLYFAVELRHQPAFYGVFQKINRWPFLADLSQADNAIPLGRSINLWLVSFSAINLLPILLGLVFYFHQKYLTPPTTATLTPEQESTQKMVKIMTVVMFPVLMYAAPSGLSLYFITNSVLAIGENKWIRHHMHQHGLLDPDKIREQAKARREGGFLSRLQKLAQQQQAAQQASNRMMRRVKNVAPEHPDRNEPKFKKRK
ncbi:MAG: membrane protein insertase YidC [Leptolyngbya sp. PLA3]|nr:MAG: membrane protein insertase YidC [Cyanobacteria bacterium CYA]MCE7969702.1 membrane protein insertase YidC [Leptolyngbya sp. PL-A3]